MTNIPAGDRKANREAVIKATDHMFRAFLEHAETNELTLMDVFMVAHNIHKQMVTNVAARWFADGIEPDHVFREADMTWRQAMRDMKRARFAAATAKPVKTEPSP